jgi:lysophospholipase L1-like esterase
MTTVKLIGDSHTQYLFPALAPFLEALGYTIVQQVSQPGWGVKKYVSDNMGFVPSDYTIVSLGGNNAELSEMAYRDSVAEFLSRLNTKDVIWLGPLFAEREDVQLRHAATDGFLNRFKKVFNFSYVPLMVPSKGIQQRDGVHLYKDGYDLLLQRILPTIERSFSSWRSYAKWFILGGVLLSGLAIWKLTTMHSSDDTLRLNP